MGMGNKVFATACYDRDDAEEYLIYTIKENVMMCKRENGLKNLVKMKTL